MVSKRCLPFHSRVSGAAAFTKNDSPYSFQRIVNLLDISTPENVDVTCFHVNGAMAAGERNACMEAFKKEPIAVMSNARCLNEGVDVPLVDSIAFIDPKKSIIDIVQATGRAMGKEIAMKEKTGIRACKRLKGLFKIVKHQNTIILKIC